MELELWVQITAGKHSIKQTFLPNHVKYPEKLLLLLHAKGTELLVELAT